MDYFPLRSYFRHPFFPRHGRPLGLCAAFKELAQLTWSELDYGHSRNLSPGEESITDTRLLDLDYLCSPNIRIHKFNRRQERINGADWEWFIGGNGGWFHMRVQAKRLTLSSERYEDLIKRKYLNGARLPRTIQVNALIRDAAKNNAYPVYCFYNCLLSDPNHLIKQNTLCPVEKITNFGCTLGDAKKIRIHIRAKRDSFSQLLPDMSPWHCLVCGPGKPNLAGKSRDFALRLSGPEKAAQDVPPLRAELPPYALVAAVGADNQVELPDTRLAGVAIISNEEIEQ